MGELPWAALRERVVGRRRAHRQPVEVRALRRWLLVRLGSRLAARYAPLAVGTETDGSITCPASLCGVVGLKPTVGTVPVEGVAPIAASQDSPGPMARSVADVGALLSVLAGQPVAAERDPTGRAADATSWGSPGPGCRATRPPTPCSPGPSRPSGPRE